MEKSFGDLIIEGRRRKEWKVKDFIEAIGRTGVKAPTPAFITRVEVHGEIPGPELICAMAEVLGYDPEMMLDKARDRKLRVFDENLEEKYKKAAGEYRTARRRTD